MKRIAVLLLLLCCISPGLSVAQIVGNADQFQVTDIRVEGTYRVSAGTIFAALPIRVGDVVNQFTLRDATRQLFQTGLFENIEIGRDGNVLVINVSELPAISEINIDGNKAIKTDDLMRSMNDNGLAEGQILKRATLEGLSQSLEREYVNQGRYGASVTTEVIDQPNNQVRVNINVNEGKEARIKHINIVGNEVFDDKTLLELFEVKTTGWFSWLSGNDKYSNEKLRGDVERLESYYLDRGYLQFDLQSPLVSMSPDKQAIYITINISEGDVFTVNKIDLAGDPILPEETIRQFIVMREGQTFSQYLMTTSSEYINQILGNEGYTFSETRGIPELNEEDKTVDVTFFIDPGSRAYVHRIDFRGNTKTSDEVLRREMRQMEGGSASTARIERSKERLEQLGYFKEVNVETAEVPGTSDQVEVEYTVEEQPSGQIGFQVGYSEGFGAQIGANVSDRNWFGTGNQVGFSINRNRFQESYDFNFTDPYFTVDGVSRGFRVFLRETNYEDFGVIAFSNDSYGGSVNFGYPLSERSFLRFGLGYTHMEIEAPAGSAQEIVTSPVLFNNFPPTDPPNGRPPRYILQSDINDTSLTTPYPFTEFMPGSSVEAGNPPGFLNEHGNEFDTVNFTLSVVESTLNRGILATRGYQQRLSLEVSLPGGDPEYYKILYDAQYFKPLTDSLTLRLRANLGYVGSYGETKNVPFFQHFYAGGFGSIRGFERNSIGPRSTPFEQYLSADSDGNAVADAYILCDTTGNFCSEQTNRLASQRLGREDLPAGGNLLVETSIEVLFPLPFVKDQRTVQSAFFIDSGSVFDTDCEEDFQLGCLDVSFDSLSSAAGIGLTWLSGFGPLTFSVSKPLHKQELDEDEFFEFSLGTSF